MPLYGFSERRTAEKLRKLVTSTSQAPPEGQPEMGTQVLVVAPTGGIPGSDGTNAGVAECDFRFISDDAGLLADWNNQDGAPFKDDVFNITTSPIPEGAELSAVAVGNRWIAVAAAAGGNKMFMTPAGGIPARAGIVAGKATCPEYNIDDATGNIATTGATNEVYNPFSTPIAGSVYILAQLTGGVWVIDAEDCSETLCDAIINNCEPYSQPDP